MSKDKGHKPLSTTDQIRCQAEARLRAKREARPSQVNLAEARRLLHELEVHQIELEMQNAELSQTRDELEKALANYTDLYDFAPVGYFTLDHKGVVNAVNLAGATILGVERSQLIGRRYGQFVEPPDRPVFTAFLDTVFTSQGKEACEVTLRAEKNSSIFVHIEATSCASGKTCRIAVIDINNRKQAEEEIQRYIEELQNVNMELSRFNIASVNRELRMIELKKEVNKLHVESGRPARYPLEFEEADEKGT